MNLKPSFRPGPDGIPSFILKEFHSSLSAALHKLFNLSLSIGHIPAIWKESYLIPLLKNGSRLNVENYRGIAKLSAVPKLFEELIVKQISFDLNKAISSSQHGFLSGRSTVTNLLEFSNHIFHQFSKSNQTDAIYTDFSKAFDVVNHGLLIMKLRMYGLPENLIEWITSYLSNRVQKVTYNNDLSSDIFVSSGVPQGSHLGPLLFLLFINDLPDVICHSSILMYADDVKLFNSFKEPNNLLQIDLNNFFEWCQLNLLQLNFKKCKIITFCRTSGHVTNYFLGDRSVERVNSVVDLGVLLDSKLRFNLHIDSIINKAFNRLSCIKRFAKEFNDPYVTKLLFTSLVRPILEYASIIWCPSFSCDIIRIESVQKQFLLFCLRNLGWDSPYSLPPYESRLKLISLPTLVSRRHMLNSIFILKLLKSEVNCPNLLRCININVPFRASRYYNFLSVKQFNTNYLSNQPICNLCKSFNDLYQLIDFNQPLYLLKRDIINFLN